MRLYIVRHGIAVPTDTPGIKDEDRPLTEDGISKMKENASGLRRLEFIPEILLSSPLCRARQTSEILLEKFGKGIEFRITPALAPSNERKDIYEQIRLHNRQSKKSLMIVGHQPDLGRIAGEIVFGSSENFLELKKGGVCAIELESVEGVPTGHLIALLPPFILRKVVA